MYSNIFKLLLLFLAPTLICEAEPEKKKILIGEIKTNIDPRTNRYTKLLLDEGEKDDYDIIILYHILISCFESYFDIMI